MRKPKSVIRVNGKKYYTTFGTHGFRNLKQCKQSKRRLKKDGYDAVIRKYKEGCVVFGRPRRKRKR